MPVEPFSGDPAVKEFFDAVESAARALACDERLAPRVRASTPEEAAALIQSLSRNTRTALLVPEDHVAVRLHTLLKTSKHACPDSVGLLAVMGTAVSAQAGISRLSFDFRAMGRAAVGLLAEPKPRSLAFPATLHHGETT